MSRRPRRASPSDRRRRRRWLALALTSIGVLVWLWIGPWIRERAGLEGGGPGPRDGHLRVVSWNLANFEGEPSGHDLDRIRAHVEALDPDVLALQEIKDVEALARLLPRFELLASEQGGRGQQRLVIAWRPERVELLASAEHPQLSLGGRVRPGLAGYLRGRDGGPDFWLLTVHLKAMPDGITQRRTQWPLLRGIAAEAVTRAGPGQGDRDLVVLGDFNTTGARGASPELERRELADALAAADLRRLTNADGCTAYYDGPRRDAWQEPSEIDLVWVRALGESLASDARVSSGSHCAANRCRAFRSTPAYPVRDYSHVSDHCPVVLDLVRADDD